jgi:rare lipoprotein A
MLKKTLTICLTLLCLSQFTACCPSKTNSGQDGPPLLDVVDPKTVPDAVPKKERQVDNGKSYKVKGKRYYVLNSSKNYNKVGLASWYGRKFHGKLTSSNESFNMYAMTAASKDLPLPSYVEVTNLRNGRHVVVKVNDRGPFHSGRIIDLSYMAAKKLGFSGAGTAMVRVKAIDVDTYYAENNKKVKISKNKSTV